MHRLVQVKVKVGMLETLHATTAPPSRNGDAAIEVHPTSDVSEIQYPGEEIRNATAGQSVLHHLASSASIQNSPLVAGPHPKGLQRPAPYTMPTLSRHP